MALDDRTLRINYVDLERVNIALDADSNGTGCEITARIGRTVRCGVALLGGRARLSAFAYRIYAGGKRLGRCLGIKIETYAVHGLVTVGQLDIELASILVFVDANSLRCRKIDNQAGRHVSDLAGILGLDYHAVGQREAHLEGIGLVIGDSHLGSTLRKLDPLVGRLLGELDSRIVRADLTGLVLGRDGIRSGRQIFGIGSGVEVHLHDMLVVGILEPDEEVAVATARAVG